MIEILLCVAYAVIYGLCGYLFILALQWLVGMIPGWGAADPARGPIPPEAIRVIQAIIAIFIFIMLVLCVFGDGIGRFDLFHLHSPHQ